MAMENGPFEDVFPIENGDFIIAMLVYRSVTYWSPQGVLNVHLPSGTPFMTQRTP